MYQAHRKYKTEEKTIVKREKAEEKVKVRKENRNDLKPKVKKEVTSPVKRKYESDSDDEPLIKRAHKAKAAKPVKKRASDSVPESVSYCMLLA